MPSPASHGATVFAYLQSVYPVLRTAWEIQVDTGLSYTQVQRGIRHIKEVLGPLHGEPINYKPWYAPRGGTSKGWVQHGYRLSESAAEVREYSAWRFGIHVKQLHNLASILEAGEQKFGDSELDVLRHTIQQAAGTVEFVQKKLLNATP